MRAWWMAALLALATQGSPAPARAGEPSCLALRAGAIPSGAPVRLMLGDSTELAGQMHSVTLGRTRLWLEPQPPAGGPRSSCAFEDIQEIRPLTHRSAGAAAGMAGAFVGASLVALAHGSHPPSLTSLVLGAAAGGATGLIAFGRGTLGSPPKVPTDPLEAVPRLQPGEPLRLTLRDGSTLAGLYRSVDFDSVLLRVATGQADSAEIHSLPFRDVARIQYRQRNGLPMVPMLVCTVFGAGMGAVIGGSVGVQDGSAHPGAYPAIWAASLRSAAIGAATGLWLGAVASFTLAALAAPRSYSTVTLEGP
ncbi:MAG TPA: hypothetical protein VMS93_05875 [Candidatus Saccharimonadales bacterium]|nr:hypothetical protein [Candidatus Saccharimonadales bacterium]